MKTPILRLSFMSHILIFLFSLSTITGFSPMKMSLLTPVIFFAYFCDLLSCYQGVIPFYRCRETRGIYIHHISSITLLAMTIPSWFNIYSTKINLLLSNIISNGFTSSLNEAIMVYGVSNRLSPFTQGLELLFKIYIFSFQALLNSYYYASLLMLLDYRLKMIPLYIVCFGGWGLYGTLYPKLLKGSIYKFKKLLKNYRSPIKSLNN